MKSAFTLLLLFLLLQKNIAQNDWKEHLSHDRTAYAYHGHFLNEYGNIILTMGNHTSPMNTTEQIGLNRKSIVYWTNFGINEPSDLKIYSSRSARLGKEESHITLTTSIEGEFTENGVHSITQSNKNDIILRRIYNPVLTSLNIVDITFPIFLNNTYFITDENKLYHLDLIQEVISIEDFEGELKFHNGLDHKSYKIHDGVFSNLDDPTTGSLSLGEFDKLDNNPFNNELIVIHNSTVERYSFDDYSLTRSDDLSAAPLHHLFVENGFYYLIESEQSYSIYFFSDETSQSELYYDLPKSEEIQDFKITEFNIWQDEVIFLGLWHAPHIKENFSYVQRRYVNEVYNPTRKNLEFTDLEIEVLETLEENQFEYKYKGTITNLGDETIQNFTIYSERLGLFENVADQFIKHDFTQELAPGESMEFSGDFIYSELSSFSFHIAGVDFAIDSDMSNNSFTVNFETVSSKEIAWNEFRIAPNPSTDYIEIINAPDDIISISLISANAAEKPIPIKVSNRIDISDFPSGVYWLQISTKDKIEAHTLIKK
ncbi:MAG: T9SS type A sorting domain-containing protein [Bacteroidota bacterium]